MSKHALVTGATKGIGRAVVSRLLRDGYDVSYTWFSSNKSVSNIQTEASRFNGDAYAYECDLTPRTRLDVPFANSERKSHFLKCSPLVGLKNQFLTSGEHFL